MTKDDHLDKETAISLKADGNGFEAKAKSRFVSGFDRLLGNLTELGNVHLEGKTTSKRGKIEAEKLVVAAAVETLTAEIREDKELAMRVLESGFSQMARRYENKKAVVSATVEELNSNPASKDQETSGPDLLSEDFLNRFERYSEDAGEEEVRAKWAKVLASEIKSPGRFSAKVMRTLDEIDNQTASWFADFAAFRVGPCVPKVLHEPAYQQATALVEAGLISNPFPGVVRFALSGKDSAGKDLSVIEFGGVALSFGHADLKAAVRDCGKPELAIWEPKKDKIAIPITDITPTGVAIMEILDDRSIANAGKLISLCKEIDPEVRMLIRASNGSWRG